MGGDDCQDDIRDVAARQVVPLQPLRADAGRAIDIEPRLGGHDLALHNDAGIHLPKTHADQADHAHVRAGHVYLEPQVAIFDERDCGHQEE